MPAFAVLFVQNFLFWTAYNSTALIPPHLASLGASQGVVGAYSILGILLTVAAVIFGGRWLVTLPRVASLRWGYAAFTLASLASWFLADSLAALVALRLVAALSQVLASTVMVSLLFDLTPADKRASGLALFSVAGMLTNPVSSMAGEAVLRSFGGPALFLLATVGGAVCLAWSFGLREPTAVRRQAPPLSFWTVVVKPEVRALLVLTCLFGFFFTVLVTFLPHHTQETLGEPNLSAFLIPFSVVSILLRIFVGPSLDRRPPRRFLHLSFLAVVVSQGFLLLPPSWLWLAAAGLFYGLGHSILYPLLNTLFVQAGPEDQRAVYSNVYTVANLGAAVVVTPLLGFVGDAAGFSAIVAILATAALVSVVLARRRFPKPAKDRPSARSS